MDKMIMLSKKQIKAIRVCLGVNDDLRHDLDVRFDAIWQFIDNNLSMFSADDMIYLSGLKNNDFDNYEKQLNYMCNCVKYGIFFQD